MVSHFVNYSRWLCSTFLGSMPPRLLSNLQKFCEFFYDKKYHCSSLPRQQTWHDLNPIYNDRKKMKNKEIEDKTRSVSCILLHLDSIHGSGFWSIEYTFSNWWRTCQRMYGNYDVQGCDLSIYLQYFLICAFSPEFVRTSVLAIVCSWLIML